MKLEVGKYYRTRNGLRIGPCQPHDGTDDWQFNVPLPCGAERWHREDGESIGTDAFDIIAEWTDEPAPEIANPNKYARKINGASVDVYDILRAFGVTCPAAQHAIKKLLMPGQRGGKTKAQDLREALASVHRAIELEDGK